MPPTKEAEVSMKPFGFWKLTRYSWIWEKKMPHQPLLAQGLLQTILGNRPPNLCSLIPQMPSRKPMNLRAAALGGLGWECPTPAWIPITWQKQFGCFHCFTHLPQVSRKSCQLNVWQKHPDVRYKECHLQLNVCKKTHRLRANNERFCLLNARYAIEWKCYFHP